MMKLLLVYSSFLFLLNLGCGSQKLVESSDKESSVTDFPAEESEELEDTDNLLETPDNMEMISNDAYSVSTFIRFPKQQSGCYNYFANSKSDYENGQFLFASNNQKQAVISIYDQLINLTNKSSTKNSSTQLVEEWNSQNYKVIVIFNDKIDAEGEKEINGTLNIMDNDGNIVTKVLYGKITC